MGFQDHTRYSDTERAAMRIVAYGGGTNSTAMLIGLHERGEKVDLITFADTGAEKPHTYRHLEFVSNWCELVGFPRITIVKKVTTVSRFERIGTYTTLEEECFAKQTLPSIAYGFKSCSQKYKREPQDKFCNSWEPATIVWKSGGKVEKCIGYDADEERRAKIRESDKYTYRYPLIEWGWGREECVEAIARAGMDQPGKSACFFCPSSKKPEILDLRKNYPDLLARALAMEEQAKLTSVKGLGRNFNWRQYLNTVDAGAEQPSDACVPEQDCGCYDGE